MKLNHIRPNQVLRISDRYSDQNEIKFFMPDGSGGSLLVFESILLLKLLRIVDPDFIFEFGTYKGQTTRFLLENITNREKNQFLKKRIYTLDLPSLDGIVFQGNDNLLATEALSSEREYIKSRNSSLVEQILQDSLLLNENDFSKKFQFILIDANHELSYVKSDTEKSFTMLADAPSVIVWHDYGNPQFPQLTNYIEELASIKRIFHIEETMLAFFANGFDVVESL